MNGCRCSWSTPAPVWVGVSSTFRCCRPGWGGQTVGQKFLGLRVVKLIGKPMTVMHCLARYVGSAAGMATGGSGFAQVLWDPSRQGQHDQAARTALVDLRAVRQAAAAPPEPPPPST